MTWGRKAPTPVPPEPKRSSHMVQLGDTVRDQITNFRGVVVGVADYAASVVRQAAARRRPAGEPCAGQVATTVPRWSERTRFELGDEASNGVSTGIVQWSDYINSTTGRRFLVVRVTAGQKIGQRIPARYPWAPLLDYDPPTSTFRCGSCDRMYRAPASRGHCRQCVRKDEGDTRQGTTRAGPGRRFASDGTGHDINPAPVPAKDRDDGSPF